MLLCAPVDWKVGLGIVRLGPTLIPLYSPLSSPNTFSFQIYKTQNRFISGPNLKIYKYENETQPELFAHHFLLSLWY